MVALAAADQSIRKFLFYRVSHKPKQLIPFRISVLNVIAGHCPDIKIQDCRSMLFCLDAADLFIGKLV